MTDEWRVPTDPPSIKRRPLVPQDDVEIGQDIDKPGEDTGRYARTALGDLSVAQARWWNSPLDMIIKLSFLFLYIIMTLFSAAFLVPLTLNAVVNALFYIIFPFAFAAFAAIATVFSLIDLFNVGLSYESRDSLGRRIIVSYRDRSLNVMLGGIALMVNITVGILWAVWYGQHNDLDKPSEFLVFGRGVVQYYGLVVLSAAIYILSPISALVSVYANVRYEMGVHLADALMMRTRGENLEYILGAKP